MARETALRTLFQQEFQDLPWQEAFQNSLEEAEGMTEKNIAFSKEIVEGVNLRRLDLDSALDEFAVDWRIERVARLEKTVLRMALFELMFMEDVPRGVSVNEAIELVKTFSTEEAAKFVNGILGNVIKHMNFLPEKVKKDEDSK
jgi:N utilization substance protein B